MIIVDDMLVLGDAQKQSISGTVNMNGLEGRNVADILICGMDIPKDGRKHTALLQFLEDGKCRGIVEYSKSYDDRSVKVFEVVPLPEGHGRLVDAREVLEKADKAPWFDGDVAELGLLIGSEVTTIVPAEGGTEDA